MGADRTSFQFRVDRLFCQRATVDTGVDRYRRCCTGKEISWSF